MLKPDEPRMKYPKARRDIRLEVEIEEKMRQLKLERMNNPELNKRIDRLYKENTEQCKNCGEIKHKDQYICRSCGIADIEGYHEKRSKTVLKERLYVASLILAVTVIYMFLAKII